MAATDVDSAMAAAVAALRAGDYATAQTEAVAAQGLCAVLPSGGDGAHSLQWSAEKIEQFIVNVRRLGTRPAAGSRGIRYSKVEYVRETDDSDDD